MIKPIEEPTPVIYTCATCDARYLSNTGYESDKPNGYYVDLRAVMGDRYATHLVTGAPMFFCSASCLSQIPAQLDRFLVPTEPATRGPEGSLK